MKSHIITGLPFKDDFTENGLGERYFNKMKEFSGEINQIDSVTGKTETVESVMKKAIQIATELNTRNVGENDVVAMCTRTRMEETSVMLGTLFIGAELGAVDPELSREEFHYVFTTLKPKVIFCDARSLITLDKYYKQKTCIVYVFGSKDAGDKSTTYKNIFLRDPDPNFKPNPIPDNYKKTAFIIASEGVNDKPKMIKISHFATYMRVSILLTQFCQSMNRTISYFPLMGTSQIILTLLTFEKSITRVIPKSFNEHDTCRVISEYQCDFAIMGTNKAMKLATYISVGEDFDLSCLKAILIGGMPTRANLVAKIINMLPKVLIANIYSVAECGFIAGLPPEKSSAIMLKPGTCGKLFPGSHVKIVNYVTNQVVGPDTWGELHYQGADLALGYVDESGRHLPFIENGFFRTGDVAQYDEHGSIYIQGRLDDIILSRGEPFMASNIEDTCLLHPRVIECAVTYNQTRELLSLYVVLSNNDIQKKTLFEFLAKHLPPRKIPDRICIMNELPKTKSGKPKKYLIEREMIKKSIIIY